jgi:hypothetical protein
MQRVLEEMRSKMYVVGRFPTLNDVEGQIGNGSLSDIMGH